MGKYKSIAVIYGSDSSEWEVSCRSGEFVASRIDGNEYDIYEIFARFGKWELVACKKKDSMRQPFPEGARPQVDKTDFSIVLMGAKVNFDYAYIVQHGSPGENGLMQGYLEMLGIPCSSCGSYASAIAFDKYACKSFIRNLGIVKCAPDVFVREGDSIACDLEYPVFVKPTQAGSSFGVTMVKKPEDLEAAVRFGFTECPTVIIEQGLHGRELTCAAYSVNGEVKALPIIEIVTDNEYFDYDAKYNGHSKEICPAPVDDSLRDQVQEATCRLYSAIGCKGVVRMDYISTEDGLYFLEINTIPGMTSASLVPKMVRTAGIDMTDFLTAIIENS